MSVRTFKGCQYTKISADNHIFSTEASGTQKKGNVRIFFVPLNVPLSAKEPVQRWWCSSGGTACLVGEGIQDPLALLCNTPFSPSQDMTFDIICWYESNY